ncbi:hypothetical protein [Pandoraea sp. PE-S2R-1]|uniref:hypothetical protein n=1 Tax=Pandoraea sp. PE-S2R-1 TaxID=1986994 RepID=UPI000B404DCC|nr:hypothetical protein [Pandoraea sp. PE-S2R-1]
MEPRSSDDTMQAAQDRGAQYISDEWAQPENLPLAQAANKSGLSGTTINRGRHDGRFYALLPPGQTRGRRYPEWQFNLSDPERLTIVLKAFRDHDASCWVIHNFMTRPLQAIGAQVPIERIRVVDEPLQPVIDAIRRRYTDEQGAS